MNLDVGPVETGGRKGFILKLQGFAGNRNLFGSTKDADSQYEPLGAT